MAPKEEVVTKLSGQIAALRDVLGVLLESMPANALNNHDMLLRLRKLNEEPPRFKERAASGGYHQMVDIFLFKISN